MFWRVPSQYLEGISNLIFNSLPRLMTAIPQFEILNPVIRSVAIDVMHGFVRLQTASQLFFHHVTMLFDPSLATRIGLNRDITVASISPSSEGQIVGLDRPVEITPLIPSMVVRFAKSFSKVTLITRRNLAWAAAHALRRVQWPPAPRTRVVHPAQALRQAWAIAAVQCAQGVSHRSAPGRLSLGGLSSISRVAH